MEHIKRLIFTIMAILTFVVIIGIGIYFLIQLRTYRKAEYSFKKENASKNMGIALIVCLAVIFAFIQLCISLDK